MVSFGRFRRKLEQISACLPAVIWSAWVAALIWLLVGNRYQAFLRPGFRPLLVLGLAVLLLFLLAFFRCLPPPAAEKPAGRWAKTAVLLLPLMFLHAVYDQGLGAGAFAGRAVGGDPTVFLPPPEPDESAPVFQPGDPVLLSDLIRRSERYRTQEVTVEGTVYRDENVPPGYFLMYRFLIFCCAADALPVWVVVRTPQSTELATDNWVQVKGRFAFETINNQRIPVIAAESVTIMPLPPPEARYLFF
jgi:uncharacterized repeat protein (TIGR03943 family)